MKSLTIILLTALPSLTIAATATATNTDSAGFPKSTDAGAFLSSAIPSAVPTWATGKYETTLASALYSVETSFYEASSHSSIADAIYSAASNYGGDGVVSSIDASGWNWGDITTNSWYTAHVPKDVQTQVIEFDAAWESVYTSVEAAAIATSSSKGAAAAPRCTGMVQAAGVAAGVAVAVAGVI